jgi:hypothetical protein
MSYAEGRTQATHGGDYGVQVDGFHEASGNVELCGDLTRIVPRRHAQNGNGAESRLTLLVPPELDAVHDRHHQIEQDERWVVIVQLLERLASVARRHDVEALEREIDLQHGADVGIVIHDQYRGHCCLSQTPGGARPLRAQIRTQYTPEAPTWSCFVLWAQQMRYGARDGR